MKQASTTARTQCQTCGEVAVPVGDVTVAMTEKFWWVAHCPNCGKAIYGHTNDGSIASELVAEGAKVNCGSLVEEATDWLAQVAY